MTPLIYSFILSTFLLSSPIPFDTMFSAWIRCSQQKYKASINFFNLLQNMDVYSLARKIWYVDAKKLHSSGSYTYGLLIVVGRMAYISNGYGFYFSMK
jgi:hypothetical protein